MFYRIDLYRLKVHEFPASWFFVKWSFTPFDLLAEGLQKGNWLGVRDAFHNWVMEAA